MIYIWKTIDGYDGYYEVSDEGEIRSVDRYVEYTKGKHKGTLSFIKGRVMKQSVNTAGYLVVNLRKNGTANVALVHILVATAFLENPNNLPTVNHKDGNKCNNSILNLEWASYSENNIHALKIGLRNPRGCRITQYSLNGEFIKEYRSVCEAARQTGFSRGGISHCINGRCKTSSGFIWIKLSESATTIPQGSTPEDELLVEAQRPTE